MKKALSIVNKVFLILNIVGIVASIVIIVVYAVGLPRVADIAAQANVTEEQARAVLISMLGSGITSLIACIIGLIFNFVNKKTIAENTERTKYIVWGVLNIVLTSNLPVGVLMIVEGAIHGGKQEVVDAE